jgi:hypothetical protein
VFIFGEHAFYFLVARPAPHHQSETGKTEPCWSALRGVFTFGEHALLISLSRRLRRTAAFRSAKVSCFAHRKFIFGEQDFIYDKAEPGMNVAHLHL